jgi:16S rRNA (cytosine967-C5)-methyltransferase
MSRVENQRRLFLELVEDLRPHWRHDPGQPQRLAEWLGRHRAGSRDRKLYRELTYTLWRILPWVENAAPDVLVRRVAQHAEPTKATHDFIAAFSPVKAEADRPGRSLLPDWLAEEYPAMADEAEVSCLLSRAPLWIRQQTDNAADIRAAFAEAQPSPAVPGAWRLPTATPVANSDLYRSGAVEIQDIGSQALLHALPPLRPGRWLDACAGAGGKTLQLAHLLRNAPDAQIVAHDIRAKALQQLELRRTRAGLTNITVTSQLAGDFDVVLIDAPCSGSGTWRRAPHLKWTTSPASLRRAAERQRNLLADYAGRVRPGGWLIYFTCSLCASENQRVIADFIETHREFSPLSLRHPVTAAAIPRGQLTLPPTALDSDGYFVAGLTRS